MVIPPGNIPLAPSPATARPNKHRTFRCAGGNGGPGREKEESEREGSFDVKPLEHFPPYWEGSIRREKETAGIPRAVG